MMKISAVIMALQLLAAAPACVELARPAGPYWVETDWTQVNQMAELREMTMKKSDVVPCPHCNGTGYTGN